MQLSTQDRTWLTAEPVFPGYTMDFSALGHCLAAAAGKVVIA